MLPENYAMYRYAETIDIEQFHPISSGIDLLKWSGIPKNRNTDKIQCAPLHLYEAYSCKHAFSVVSSNHGETRRLTAGTIHSLVSTATIKMQPDVKGICAITSSARIATGIKQDRGGRRCDYVPCLMDWLSVGLYHSDSVIFSRKGRQWILLKKNTNPISTKSRWDTQQRVSTR
jgi:hypothetical protein